MNLSKPIHIILIGSSLLFGLVLITLILVQEYGGLELGIFTLIAIPLITFLISLGVFTYLVGRFINEQIKSIYRVISNKQFSEENEYSLSEDVLSKMTEDTTEWAAIQKRQISQLEKQAAFRKEFLGNLAHELKTPVFSIQGYILTLLEGGLEDKRVNRDFLLRALSGVDRISNLLDDLDEIAKFETDRLELKIEKVDIVNLIRSTFKELEPKGKKKKIELKFERHYEPIFVQADKNRITQVLINLISNSISYGAEGGKTTISIQNFQSKQVLISIADDGIGMAEEHIPRLFERFYRVDKSRERNIGGSGLGLAIVKHVIEAHKQSINVQSTIGLGSTFSFTLDKQ